MPKPASRGLRPGSWLPKAPAWSWPDALLVDGDQGRPGFAPYGTAKEGMRGLTKHPARGWGRYGIRVNVVAPADLGEGSARFRDEAPRLWEAILSQIPLGYMGDAEEDIGRGILALVTDLQYLTGATLALDGGRCILR